MLKRNKTRFKVFFFHKLSRNELVAPGTVLLAQWMSIYLPTQQTCVPAPLPKSPHVVERLSPLD